MNKGLPYNVARLIVESEKNIVLTGAGISVDSGIPDFRSPGGLWERFDPMDYAHIQAFYDDPVRVWEMLRELRGLVEGALPNPGHESLAELEQMGYLDAVITQNVDDLHQAAGSKNVIEFHGNGSRLLCLSCGKKFSRDHDFGEIFPPRCTCDIILKPDVVFFGEAIPWEANLLAREEAKNCKVIMVVGTSATVAPASSIPVIAKQNGAKVVEINIQETILTKAIADYCLLGSSSEIIPSILDEVKKIITA